MIARNDPPNSLEMLVLVLNEMVLVLERRSRDPCGQCRQVTPSGSLRWFIQEGSPKELLNKRRKNRDK